jgi:tetratricopeptide (TPR) repeat protein
MALEPADRYPSLPDLLADLARDPVRRRNRILAGLGAATLLVGGGFGLASVSAGPAPTCTGAADELAAVWSDERREAVRAGLTAAIPNLGATTAAAILPRLDGHADAWVTMRTDACQANQAGRQSDQLLDLRMTCLDRRLARLDALAASFSAADGDTVLNAVAAVEGIGDLSSCADVERLTAAAPLPEDPTRAAGVRQQQLALERVAAAQLTGHYNDAKTAADALTRAARDLEYAPLIAEAALARGRAHQELHEAEPAEAALAEALSAAIRVDADAVAAEAAARQIFVRSALLHDAKLALAGTDVADALVDSAGDPPDLRWLWEINLGNARYETGETAAAHLHFRRAADVAAKAGLAQSAALADANEAYLAARAGDHRTAAAGFATSAEAIEAALGPDHPTAFQIRMMLAKARWELGQAAGVRDTLAVVVPRLLHNFGPDAPDVQSANIILAEVELKYHRPDAARALADAVVTRPADVGALADGERVLGLALVGLGRADEGLAHLQSAIDRAAEIPTLRLVNLTYRGDALLELGRLDAALAAHREALAGFTAATGADSAFSAIVRSHLARTLLARGAHDEALAELRLARDTFLTHQPHSPYLAGIFETLGDLEQARGDRSAAEAALRDASDRYAATFDADHPDRNAARFKLARVIAARDPAAAAALAEQARTIYTTLGPAFAAESAAVSTWLSGQPK